MQQGRSEELQRKVESLQSALEQRDVQVSNLELSNCDLRKQLEARKKQI